MGSEFWSLPQHYGDELSGITATLTQTEQGRGEPVTYVGQPSCVRQELGTICFVPTFSFSLDLVCTYTVLFYLLGIQSFALHYIYPFTQNSHTHSHTDDGAAMQLT